MDAITPTSGAGGISPLTPTPGTDATKASPSPAPSPAFGEDKVQISPQGVQAAKHVEQAKVIAPLDEETVKKLKAAIAEGRYPAPAIVAGLVNLVGNNLAAERDAA